MAGARKRISLLCATDVLREISLGFRDSRDIADRLTLQSKLGTPADLEPDVFTADDVETMLRRFARGAMVEFKKDGWHLLDEGEAYLRRYTEEQGVDQLFFGKKPKN